jgi:hypothetical protein
MQCRRRAAVEWRMDVKQSVLLKLAEHLQRERGALLKRWRASVRNDSGLTSGKSLPRAQIEDHVPSAGIAFERHLIDSAWSNEAGASAGTLDAAAGHVNDLESALAELNELDQHRATLWQQLAHDLRGNVGVVAAATRAIALKDAPESSRERFTRMLERNVDSLRHLLDDVHRLAQNLILNALKYTERGGVDVRWAPCVTDDSKRWSLTVQDTGPGIHAGPGSPLVEVWRSCSTRRWKSSRIHVLARRSPFLCQKAMRFET